MDLLSIDDHEPAGIVRLLERAAQLADRWEERRMPQGLTGMRVCLIVNETGWRNPAAFELGTRSMGGICVQSPINLEGPEALADLAAYLDNWFDIVVARCPSLPRLRMLAEAAHCPVINARTRHNHPCEVLGDLAFLYHRASWRFDRLRVAVLGPQANILNSWREAAAVLPIEVQQIYPARWHASASRNEVRFSSTAEFSELAGADVIITDCWPPDGDANTLLPYQISAAALSDFAPQAVFIPCPPVTRGQEVSADAMTSPACRTFESKAYLLHVQNAILEAIASHPKEDLSSRSSSAAKSLTPPVEMPEGLIR